MKLGWLTLVGAAFLCLGASAQKRYNVWAIGDSLGFNFNKQPVTFINTASSGVAPDVRMTAICDTFGDLLFYSNGSTIWDKHNKPVARQGTRWPLAGKVIPLAVAHPGFDSAYYLLGVSTEGFDNSLVAVSIALENNRPTIVYPAGPNQPFATTLLRNASMVLAGTTHCNGTDTWIVGYAGGSLHAFLLTKTGIGPGAVVSATPFADGVQTGFSNAKFAANGECMVLPLVGENALAIFDFNNANGVFKFRMRLPVPEGFNLQDAELSPDGSKLYFAAGRRETDPEDEDVIIDRHFIYQMDLNADDAAAVEATLYAVNGKEGQRVACGERRSCAVINRTLQLGPDGHIYANQKIGSKDPYEKRVFIIESPNKAGRGAGYRLGPLESKRHYKYLNFNYIRSGSFSLRENGIQIQPQTCRDQPAIFSLLFTRVDSVRWNFGDPAAGSANTSGELRPSHVFPGPGTYHVSAVIYKSCYADTAFRDVVVSDIPSVRIPASFKDTSFCVGQTPYMLDATTPAATGYTWDNGLIYAQRTLTQSGTYTVKAFNACSEDERTLTVKIEECPCQAFVPNAFTPNGDGLNDVFRPSMACFAKDYSLTVFDRYGGMAFHSNTPGQGWKGSSGATESPAGVYMWTLRYRNPNNGKEFFDKGTVILIR